MDFEFKENYEISDLLEIVKILRSPGGCPWDMQQTHQSIKRNFLEETSEVMEAIENIDSELLKEELGDVLLQIVFHARIESELGKFDFSDVVDGICKKLITRHPHVFSDVNVKDSKEVLENWDAIKMKSKNQKTISETMESVCKALPALIRSQKVLKKSEKLEPQTETAVSNTENLRSVFEDLIKAVNQKKSSDYSEKIGKLLFYLVMLSMSLDVDAEDSLHQACDNFISDFKKIESINNDFHLAD